MAELNPKTRDRLQALCRQITVAHELDPEIQEELYGHMEDKLLAYLSGQERLTEQDAYVLVCEHFGDPAVLKTLLRSAHPRAAWVSIARRSGMAFVVFATVAMVERLSFLALASLSVCIGMRYRLLLQACILGVACIASVAPWFIFVRWQRQLNAGQLLWFQQRSSKSIGRLFVLVILACLLTPTVADTAHLTLGAPRQYRGEVSYVFEFVRFLTVAQCLAWIWWCYRPPQTARSLLWGIVTWSAWAVLSAPLFAGLLQLAFVGGTLSSPIFPGEIVSGHIEAEGKTAIWSLYLLTSSTMRNIDFDSGSWVTHTAAYTTMACSLYLFRNWRARNRHRIHDHA